MKSVCLRRADNFRDYSECQRSGSGGTALQNPNSETPQKQQHSNTLQYSPSFPSVVQVRLWLIKHAPQLQVAELVLDFSRQCWGLGLNLFIRSEPSRGRPLASKLRDRIACLPSRLAG